MARIRTVKPEYPKHRKVRRVSRDARLLNIHLWNLADDEGRLQELPRWIIGEVFPADEDVTPDVLREWLAELADAGLIVRYEVDGESYIYCHDFNGHQAINKPRPSELPAPPRNRAPSRKAPVALPEDSHGEGNGTGNREGKEKPSSAKAADAPLSNLLADLIAQNGSRRPRIGTRWLDAERLLLERDERDRSEAERLIRWCQADEFWRGNILSMPKFRQKYDQLRLQAQRHNGSTPDPAREAEARRKLLEGTG